MSNYGKEYVDRGMAKWEGMFLSEQTEQLQAIERKKTIRLNRKRK